MEIRLKSQIDPAGAGWQKLLSSQRLGYSISSRVRSFGRLEHTISNGSNTIVLIQGAQTATLNIQSGLSEGQCEMLLDLMLIGFAEIKLQVQDEFDPMAEDARAGKKIIGMLDAQQTLQNGKVTLPDRPARLIEQLSTDLHQVTSRLRFYFDWDERLPLAHPSALR